MSTDNTQDQARNLKRELAIRWTRAYPMVSVYVRSMIFKLHDAEDVIQDIAVAVAENFDQFDQSREIMPWIMGIARHKVVDYIRAAANPQPTFDSHTMQQISEAFTSIENESGDMREALDKCISRLKKRPRHVLELRYLREMTISDIAERLDLSSNAIYVMLHRIRSVLAECIEKKTSIEWGL